MTSSPRFRKQETLSAAYQNSPYLKPVFPVLSPRFNRFRKQKYIYPYQYQNQEIPEIAQPPNSARPNQMGPRMSYIERTKNFEKREKSYDRKLSEKYKVENPMSPYKSSMWGAYRKNILIAKKQANQKEHEQFQSSNQYKRKRLLENYNYAFNVHRKQALEELNEVYQ